MRISCALVGILLIALMAMPCEVVAASLPRDSAEMRDRHRSSYLVVSGKRLVLPSGRAVTLRGVNLGGWLVIEDWMCGITDDADTLAANGSEGVAGRGALETLEARFGTAGAEALRKLWEDNWITAADLDLIRAGGFNLVRVPISFRTLQNADGSWILDASDRIDFGRMDWIVREAAARGIYTIFDLHVWPEQRRAYQKIGRADGAAIRTAMADLWTRIASHYRGNGAVAAFDLINEFPGAWGVQQVFAAAVRQADPRRVLIVEGFTFDEYRQLHADGIFPDSVFSDHFYEATPLATATVTARLQALADSPAPVYIGEILAADFPEAVAAMDRDGVAWSSWTYKTVDMGDWGAVNYPPALKIDIQHDSYADIAARWSTGLIAWRASDIDIVGLTLNVDRLDIGGTVGDPRMLASEAEVNAKLRGGPREPRAGRLPR